MRNFLLALVAVLVPVVASAEGEPVDQKAGKLGADGAIVLPFGEWGDMAGIGFGATLHYDHALNQDWSLTGRTGYVYHSGKELLFWDYSTSEVPIMFGAKYHLANVPGLYAGAELGFTIWSITATTDDPTAKALGLDEIDDSSTEFGMTLGAGYSMGNLDFAARLYMPDFDATGLMATVGYNFYSL